MNTDVPLSWKTMVGTADLRILMMFGEQPGGVSSPCLKEPLGMVDRGDLLVGQIACSVKFWMGWVMWPKNQIPDFFIPPSIFHVNHFLKTL